MCGFFLIEPLETQKMANRKTFVSLSKKNTTTLFLSLEGENWHFNDLRIKMDWANRLFLLALETRTHTSLSLSPIFLSLNSVCLSLCCVEFHSQLWACKIFFPFFVFFFLVIFWAVIKSPSIVMVGFDEVLWLGCRGDAVES